MYEIRNPQNIYKIQRNVKGNKILSKKGNNIDYNRLIYRKHCGMNHIEFYTTIDADEEEAKRDWNASRESECIVVKRC